MQLAESKCLEMDSRSSKEKPTAGPLKVHINSSTFYLGKSNDKTLRQMYARLNVTDQIHSKK